MIQVTRGVAALCLPWNDPVAIACTQIAANLMVGNTVICKPSEKTPLATAAVTRLLNLDLPPGVPQAGRRRRGRWARPSPPTTGSAWWSTSAR